MSYNLQTFAQLDYATPTASESECGCLQSMFNLQTTDPLDYRVHTHINANMVGIKTFKIHTLQVVQYKHQLHGTSV